MNSVGCYWRQEMPMMTLSNHSTDDINAEGAINCAPTNRRHEQFERKRAASCEAALPVYETLFALEVELRFEVAEFGIFLRFRFERSIHFNGFVYVGQHISTAVHARCDDCFEVMRNC